jgi:hypothetical protein
VADAVWLQVLEAGYSAQDIMRLLSAYAAGDAVGLDSNPAFTGLDDSTVRLAGTISGGNRTITTRDPS